MQRRRFDSDVGNGGRMRREGIVNLATHGMLVVSVARRLGSEGPLLTYAVPRS
jgi:hypothetical protein